MEKRLDNKQLSKKLVDNYYKKFSTTASEVRKIVKSELEKFTANNKWNEKLPIKTP